MMGKRLVIFCLMSVLLSACTSDDQSAPPDSNVTIDGNVLEFTMSWKTLIPDENVNGMKLTLYHVAETCGKCTVPPPYKKMELHVVPTAPNRLEGTYDVSHEVSPGLVSGSFYNSGFPVNFRSGSITIAKKGGSRYKIEFTSVTGTFWQDPSRIYNFGGYFEGNFPKKDQ